MRLIILLLIPLSTTTAQTAPLPDVFGVWVADLPKADQNLAEVPEHLFLKIVNDSGVKLIEVRFGKTGYP